MRSPPDVSAILTDTLSKSTEALINQLYNLVQSLSWLPREVFYYALWGKLQLVFLTKLATFKKYFLAAKFSLSDLFFEPIPINIFKLIFLILITKERFDAIQGQTF